MKTPKKTTALLGYGTVGQGFYSYLEENAHPKALKGIAINNGDKERDPIKIGFTEKVKELIEDKDIKFIVEAINDTQSAFEYVSLALKNNKQVTSANKKMIALHLEELIALENKSSGRLLYEASVAGGIPILRMLNNYYDLDNITKIEGIINSTSNYVLSQIFNEQIGYLETIEKLKRLGYTEKDPIADINGDDALYKLIILTAHAYGKFFAPEKVLKLGLENIKDSDIQFAIENNLKIKLIASVESYNNKLWLSVLPTFVNASSPFFNIENEYNAIEITSENLGKQLLTGKGVGSLPTGQALYSDYVANDSFKYKYDKILSGKRIRYQTEQCIWVYSDHITLLEKYLEELVIIDRSEGYAKIAIGDLIKVQEEIRDEKFSMIAVPENVLKQLNKKYEYAYALQFA